MGRVANLALAVCSALVCWCCQPSIDDSIDRLGGTQAEREEAQQELLLAQDHVAGPLLAAR